MTMKRQLATYASAANTSPRRCSSCDGDATSHPNTTTPARQSSDAGMRRRYRRNQNRRRSMRPSALNSQISSIVIRNPDTVKNVDTPRNPPRAHPNPAWNSSTAATATPRSPSSPGRVGMVVRFSTSLERVGRSGALARWINGSATDTGRG